MSKEDTAAYQCEKVSNITAILLWCHRGVKLNIIQIN